MAAFQLRYDSPALQSNAEGVRLFQQALQTAPKALTGFGSSLRSLGDDYSKRAQFFNRQAEDAINNAFRYSEEERTIQDRASKDLANETLTAMQNAKSPQEVKAIQEAYNKDIAAKGLRYHNLASALASRDLDFSTRNLANAEAAVQSYLRSRPDLLADDRYLFDPTYNKLVAQVNTIKGRINGLSAAAEKGLNPKSLSVAGATEGIIASKALQVAAEKDFIRHVGNLEVNGNPLSAYGREQAYNVFSATNSSAFKQFKVLADRYGIDVYRALDLVYGDGFSKPLKEQGLDNFSKQPQTIMTRDSIGQHLSTISLNKEKEAATAATPNTPNTTPTPTATPSNSKEGVQDPSIQDLYNNWKSLDIEKRELVARGLTDPTIDSQLEQAKYNLDRTIANKAQEDYYNKDSDLYTIFSGPEFKGSLTTPELPTSLPEYDVLSDKFTNAFMPYDVNKAKSYITEAEADYSKGLRESVLSNQTKPTTQPQPQSQSASQTQPQQQNQNQALEKQATKLEKAPPPIGSNATNLRELADAVIASKNLGEISSLLQKQKEYKQPLIDYLRSSDHDLYTDWLRSVSGANIARGQDSTTSTVEAVNIMTSSLDANIERLKSQLNNLGKSKGYGSMEDHDKIADPEKAISEALQLTGSKNKNSESTAQIAEKMEDLYEEAFKLAADSNIDISKRDILFAAAGMVNGSAFPRLKDLLGMKNISTSARLAFAKELLERARFRQLYTKVKSYESDVNSLKTKISNLQMTTLTSRQKIGLTENLSDSQRTKLQKAEQSIGRLAAMIPEISSLQGGVSSIKIDL